MIMWINDETLPFCLHFGRQTWLYQCSAVVAFPLDYGQTYFDRDQQCCMLVGIGSVG